MNFDAAWRAFEQDDARIKAPAVLEGRVLHTLRASRVERSRRRMVFAKPNLCATAAALLLGMLVRRPDDAPPLRKTGVTFACERHGPGGVEAGGETRPAGHSRA